MVAEVKGYKGFTETNPNDPVTGKIDSSDKDKKKQPGSASMVALQMLPSVDHTTIGATAMLPFNYFLGAPQRPQALAAAPTQQDGKKADEKKEQSGGMQITVGEPKKPEDGKKPEEGNKPEKA